MRLNVSVPVSEITGNWRSLINKIVIVSVILLALAVVLTMRLAEKITKPLRKLTEAAKQVDEGNYEVELEHSGSDEVAVLSHTFGQLIEHQKEYINELNDLNQKLKDDNLTLEAATIRDSLTGVKNRFALRRDYDGYTEQEIHIMMLDIDDFKKVNDNYGHSVGDYLLKKTGDTLIDLFGAEHSYRYGGDEFMVIYPDIQESVFTKLVSDMGSWLEEIYLEDKKLPVHFSAGYVYGKILLPDDLRLMIRQADELLYKAKGSGKSTFFGESYDRDSAMNIKKKAEEAFRHG
jgi:diguanylate cyclase (GGDEF)-like protein